MVFGLLLSFETRLICILMYENIVTKKVIYTRKYPLKECIWRKKRGVGTNSEY